MEKKVLSTIKLTARQKAFLAELVKLYKENQKPVHYTKVASNLGVSKFSAYDMMRVLMDKGLINRVYVLEKEVNGPGRSQVMFAPTPEGEEALTSEYQGISTKEWRRFRRNLLNKLIRNKFSPKLLHELLNSSSEKEEHPLFVAANISAAFVIAITDLKRRVRYVNPYDAVEKMIGGEAGLGTLAGISLGAMLARAGEEVDGDLVYQIYKSVERYQDALSKLGDENKRRLKNFLKEVISAYSESEREAAEAG